MAKDERKRQKALAKKKQREIRIRKEANIQRNPSPGEVLRSAVRGEWVACYETEDSGMSSLYCVRSTPSGFIGASFLVDMYCLGIKFTELLRNLDLQALSEHVKDRGAKTVSPAYALKKIQFAIEEAQKYGFPPHPDTEMHLRIFQDVDPTECSDEFEFGRDGKPFYLPGPYESEHRQTEILIKLAESGYLESAKTSDS